MAHIMFVGFVDSGVIQRMLVFHRKLKRQVCCINDGFFINDPL